MSMMILHIKITISIRISMAQAFLTMFGLKEKTNRAPELERLNSESTALL
jgi:hypothetical protein